MSENALISIIVPVYNVEKYLDRCMESILGQTYQNIEVLLVDDGSTDSSPRMCDDYAQKDGRVKVIHKQNGGLSDARNAGLQSASGSYIGYVDSDDWIETDMYERMYMACVENNAQLAVCRYFSEYSVKSFPKSAEGTVDEELSCMQYRTESGGNGSVVPLSRDELLKIYICGHSDYVIYNSVWSKLFKRELVEGMVFPKGRNSEDIMYTTKAFCRAEKAVYLDSCFYHYVLDREGSIMNVARGERMFRDEIPFWREHIDCIEENVSTQMADLARYHLQRRLLFYYIDAKNSKDKDYQKMASGLVAEIKKDKDETDRVYNSGIVSKGDRMRRKLFIMSPSVYALVVKLYDKIIIPLRQGS